MIRSSKNEDLEQIMELWLTSNLTAHHFVDPEFWENVYELVKESIAQGVVVYEDNGEVVGFIGMIGEYIAGLFVKETMQGRGIGTALLEYEKSHNESLSLHVFEKNSKAVRFYEGQGFTKKGHIYNEHCREMEFTMEWIG